MSVLSNLSRGARKQASTLRGVITSPRGPFATTDAIVKNARSTARSTLRSAGAKGPMNAMKMRGGRPLSRIKRMSPKKLRAQARRRMPKGMGLGKRIRRR